MSLIRLVCQCGHRWTETLALQVHVLLFCETVASFHCPQCGRDAEEGISFDTTRATEEVHA